MKRILIIMFSLSNGGAERSLLNLLSIMDEKRYQVDLMLMRKEGAFLKQLPSNVTLLDTPNDINYLFKSFDCIHDMLKQPLIVGIRLIGMMYDRLFFKGSVKGKQMRWKYIYSPFIKKYKPHYELAISYIDGEPLYYTAEKVSADKKITWVHNDYNLLGYDKELDREYFSVFDKIVSISEGCVEILRKVFPEYTKRMVYLPNLSPTRILEEKAEAFYPSEYGNEVFIILSIGRLMPQKAFGRAIEAADIMKKHGVKFKWYIVGTGNLEKELKRKIEQLQVEDVISLLGLKENPYPYIKNADLFVQTSDFEGKSVVLDEAKILGTPIVATNYPTVRDQITDGENGMIVERDANEIAKAIELLMKSPDLLKRYSAAAQMYRAVGEEHIKEYYDLFDHI